MTERIFLLDGMALAYRAYFAFISSPLKNSRGENTGAVYGFTNAVLKILNDEKPERIVCVFDTPEPTFRHRRYADYKATRDKMPDDMAAQLGDLKDICRAMGVPIIELPGYEADDLIGTIAKKAAKKNLQAFIVSGDKDFTQLVEPLVSLYNPGKRNTTGEIVDEDGVRNRYGVGPQQITDILGLMGDSSDNIPGVTGIGEKTAVKLIKEFGSIEKLYENIETLKGKQKENLIRDRENAFLSKELATIDTDVPYQFGWEDFRCNRPDYDRLMELFAKLEFTSLIERFHDSISGISVPSIDSISNYDHQYIIVTDDNGLQSMTGELLSAGRFSVDTETTDLHPMFAELVGISFSAQAGRAFYVPFNGGLKPEYILQTVKPLLENPEIQKTGQHCKFDALVLMKNGIRLQGFVFDSMIAAHLLNPERSANLDLLAMDHLKYKKIPTTDIIGEKKQAIRMSEAPVEKVADYACEDAECVTRLFSVLFPQIRENSMDRLFEEIEIPLIPVLTAMEYNGVRIDTELLNRMSKEYEKELTALEIKITAEAGMSFNLNSPQQLGDVLFEKLQIQKHLGQTRVKRTGKTGQFSTDVKSLEKFRGLPVIDHILAYRQLAKLKSTYIDGMPPLVHPETGRVHSTFSQTVTATGRLSSSNPNFQNIPIRTELGREIRKAFTPGKDGWLIVSADYSQIELRVLAHMSGDVNMLDAFSHGEDFHASTASRIFNIPVAEVTPDQRRRAKDVNFGIIYGMSAFGLADRLHISNSEAAEFIDQYFGAFPGVRGFIDRTIQEAIERGFVSTMYGRRRYLPDLKNKNRNARQFAERAAVNTPIQGAAAEIIKIAMIKIHQAMIGKRMQSKMILQVHDELVFETPSTEKDDLLALIAENMENAIPLDVRLKTDVGAGANWFETK